MIIYQQSQPSTEPDFIYLGSGTSFDVKSKFSGYASLTADDFYIKEVSDYSTSRGSIQTYADGSINRRGEIVKSYNASTGTLTCYARFYYRASDSNGTGDKVDEHINCECFLRRPTATNQMIDLGTNTSFNVSSVYSNYANLTVDNFCVESSEVYSGSRGTIWGYPDGSGIRRQMRLEKSYNAQTGVLTCYLLYYYQANDSNGTGDKVNQKIKVNVFLSDVELVSEEAPNYSKEIQKIMLGTESAMSKPLSTSQNKKAGAGYSSGDLNWNGDYSTARIKTVKGNENVGLQQGDQWMTLYVKLTDGTTISDRWGNGNVNVTYNRTTNSGISYSVHVDSHNVTYTFAEEVEATQIYVSAYTMYGTWRGEGFNINLYVTGHTVTENAREISAVMLGTKELWGGAGQTSKS